MPQATTLIRASKTVVERLRLTKGIVDRNQRQTVDYYLTAGMNQDAIPLTAPKARKAKGTK